MAGISLCPAQRERRREVNAKVIVGFARAENVLGITDAHIVHPDDLRAVGVRTMEQWMQQKTIANRVRILKGRRWVWVDSVAIPDIDSFGRL